MSFDRHNRVAILTNMVAPYRRVIYDGIARHFDTTVLVSGAEGNRGSWRIGSSDQYLFRVRRSRGLVLRWFRRERGQRFDYRFLHLTPGYVSDLIRLRPDAIISAEMGARSLFALAYGLLARRPVWIHWGGTLHTERSRSRTKRAFRRVFVLACRHWISYGRSSTEYLLSIGVDRARIVEIQNCVDSNSYAPTVPAALSIVPKPVVLYVGQMIPRKGVEELLRSAARLQRKGLKFSLLLVGDGIARESYMALAKELGIESIQFEPSRPPEQMGSIYRSANWLVMPTLEDVWGLVINEALLSGLPVLGSVFAGASGELLPTEQIFDPTDPTSFDERLSWAIGHPNLGADTSRLISSDEVVRRITQSIHAALAR